MDVPPRQSIRTSREAGPGHPAGRRTFLRSLGSAAAGLGAVGLGAVVGSAHEKPTPGDADDDGSADGDESRTPDPDSYEPLATLSLPGTKELVASADGTVGYAAVTDGYATVDLSEPTSPRVLAERRRLLADREGGPLAKGHDLAVDGDLLAVVGPANPVYEGVNAVVLVDVSEPANPRQLAVHETDFPIHNCALEDGHVYLTANGVEGNPLVILNADAGLEEIGRWSLFDHDEGWREVHPSLRALHDVRVHDGIATLAHWDAGTWLLDVAAPSDPTYLADVGGVDREELAALDRQGAGRESIAPPGNSHYVATDEAGTLLAVGTESWAAPDGDGGPSGIALYDCTKPTAPELLAEIEAPPSPDPGRSGLWTTAHNFEIREGILYSSWYRGGVKRHDVSEPANPRELSWWREPDETSFWTAQAGVPGEYFVAADMAPDGASGVAGDAGIYVFPDADGSQSPPPEPALTEASAAATATAEPTTTAASTPTATPESVGTDTPTEGGSSIAQAPGFGAGSALLALGIGAAGWLRGRQGE